MSEGARRLGEVLARTLHAQVSWVRPDGERTILAGNGAARGATGSSVRVPVVRGGSAMGEVVVVGAEPPYAQIASAVAVLIAEDLAAGAEAPTISGSFADIVGRSAGTEALHALLRRVATSSSTALLLGENGTGKELCARAIHAASPRRARRFVALNCSALADSLLDSELFGHKRGAFTGAVADRSGLLSLADGGTFLLDEVADMSPALQVKLLRFLEGGTYTPVGSEEPEAVDVRMLAASNRDLERLVSKKAFREDLYYRLNVITIRVPPLRDRRPDVPDLARHFLRIHANGGSASKGTAPKRLTDETMDCLVAYHWPGNVRELENEIQRLVVLAGDDRVIGIDLVSERIREPGRAPAAEPAADGGRPAASPKLHAAVESLQRRLIADALRRNAGNKTLAAKDLGVSRRNLIRLVRRYHLHIEA